MTDLVQAALVLARAGVPVFPVGNDKAPRTPRGFKDATTSETRILGWRWDDGMIGAAIRDFEVVLDVDPRNGGLETLSVFPALPRTKTTRTKSGGFHYWFTITPGLPMRGSLGPGIDVKRAGKGYVVVPPSPGYTWRVGGAKVPLPNWLFAELEIEEKAYAASDASTAKFFPFEEGTAYGMAARRRICAELAEAENGARNDALNRASFITAQLAAGGELSREAAIVELLRVAEELGLHPWESRNTIESGWRAGEQLPRQAPGL